MTALKLFGRPECHLCIEVAESLSRLGIGFDEIDIDDNPELGARYGLSIPVLQRSDGIELEYPFDPEALEAFLAETAL